MVNRFSSLPPKPGAEGWASFILPKLSPSLDGAELAFAPCYQLLNPRVKNS
jgi:hypothetical protein